MADYDLAIIGGGLNGVSIARDAAGRGLRVILLEQGDLGAGASSASPRLIHGDLADLERRHFLRVRSALAERDVWLRIAPHLVRPMRFAIPARSDEPVWQLRSWLLLYDRLASRSGLPASATLDVTHHPIGNALKRPFGIAFEYSDCVVDDSRLVALTAVDAAARGAAIRTGARCTRAERGETWRLMTIDRGHRQAIAARALVHATGAGDVAYLCEAANRYFRERIEAFDVVRTISGANTVIDPARKGPLRDGSTLFDYGRRKAPLITIFGGDVTTSRRRAEKAVSR